MSEHPPSEKERSGDDRPWWPIILLGVLVVAGLVWSLLSILLRRPPGG